MSDELLVEKLLVDSALIERLDAIEEWLKQLELFSNRVCADLISIESRLDQLEDSINDID